MWSLITASLYSVCEEESRAEPAQYRLQRRKRLITCSCHYRVRHTQCHPRESGIPKIPRGNSREFLNYRREFPGISKIQCYSFFPYLELRWVHIYDISSELRSCRRAVVAINESSPAFYTLAYYQLSRIFLPHFLSRFLPVVTSASRTPALYP